MPPDKDDQDSDLELAAALGEAGLEDKPGAGQAAGESGRSLPKKVELDIDDMLLREIAPPEATPPPAVEQIPEPIEEKEVPAPAPAPKKKPKISRKKLLILGGAVLLPLMLTFVAVIWFFFSEEKPSPEEKAAALPQIVRLAPFIVNYPEARPEIVVRVEISLTFADASAEALFEGRKIPMRDIVFRYLQGRGPAVVRDPQASTALSQGLMRLLEEHFASGAVKNVEIAKLEEV